MICSACGQEMSDDSKFCPYCGAAAVGASDAVAAKDGEAKAPDASENLRIDADGTIHMGNRPQMPTGPAAREPERPASALQAAPAPQPASAPQPAPQPQRTGVAPQLVVALVVAAVVIGGVGMAAALTGGFGMVQSDPEPTVVRVEKGDDDTADADEGAEDATAADEGTEDGGGQAADAQGADAGTAGGSVSAGGQSTATGGEKGSSQKSAPATSSAAKSPIRVDLANATDREDLNIAITNFTELEFDKEAQSGSIAFDRSCTDYPRIINFYRNHVAYNGFEYYGFENVKQSDPLYDKNYFVRTPVKQARANIANRLGITLSDAQMTFGKDVAREDAVSAYHATVSGDWLYIGIYDGSAEPSLGVASATSLTDLGNNRYQVTYDVYVPGGYQMPKDIDSSTYGLTGDQMAARVGAAGVDRRGSAIFEVRMDGNLRRFILEEMDVSTPA